MKENDYILANILNPEFSNLDFKDILGMNMENTQILPYSSYTSSPLITLNELFQDDNGNFNERKFKDFYTTNVGKFASFNVDLPLVENFEYSIFDSSRKLKSRVKDPNFKLSVISNPDRVITGISGRNQREESKLSRSEMAQLAKIWDTERGEWLDYSPNDMALTKSPLGWFKSLFDEPLVKATWDEEGDHKDPITKRTMHHYKGDLKLNDEGQYFYETLGERSPIGKEILSSFDTLTVDGEGINKYDFIDSDGLDKSVTGTIAKTALTVAPLFLGGPALLIYSGALIAREMSKSLPMLYGMVSSLWGNEEDSRLLNTIAAYGEKFTTGTSEYSRLNTFTFENIASLIGDVATQWGLQKAIAESINKLKGSKKLVEEAYKKAAAYYSLEARSIELGAISSSHKGQMKGMSALLYIGNPKEWLNSALGKTAIKKFVEPALKIAKSNARLGADASLAYMAIISNTDVYQSMLEHGASKRDAAAVAFGSTLGMFAVDRYFGLGELFFDELRNDARLAMRGALKRETDAIAEGLIGTTGEGLIANPEVKLNALKSLILRGINLSKGVTGKFADDVKNHTTGFFGKAIGEGLEEVSEELVADLSKQLYELAGEFSPNFINTSGITDVGAWENAKERYLMSLLGGAVGGGLFYGVGVFLNGTFKRDTTQDELIYLIANNKTQEVLKELDKWKASGKFGSKTLSASKYEYNSDGKPVFLTADSEDDSLNTYIYNRIKESVLLLEHALNYTKTNLSDDDLFKLMVLRELRFLNLKEYLGDLSYVTKYQEKFRIMTKDLINAELSLSLAYKSEDGTPEGNPLPDNPGSQVLNDPKRLLNIKDLEEKVKELRELRDSFLSGEQSLPYLDKLLFAIDFPLRSAFISMTYGEWLEASKGKTVEQLSPTEKETFKEEYLAYKEHKLAFDLDLAYDLYKLIGNLVNPHISMLAENADLFEKNHEALWKLFIEGNPFEDFNKIDYDTKLEGESDESYNNRNKRLEDEEEDDFNDRVNKRKAKIIAYNDKLMKLLTEKILKIIDNAGGYIDPSTLRHLSNHFKARRSDIANDIIKNLIDNRQKTLLPGLEMNMYEVMRGLKPDFSNMEEIRSLLEEMIISPEISNLQKARLMLEPVRKGLLKMLDDFGYNYDPNNVTGATILDFMHSLADRIVSGDSSLANIFNKIGRGDVLLDLVGLDRNDILEVLMSYDSEEDGLLEAYLGEENITDENWEGLLTEEWIPFLSSIALGQDDYDMSIKSDEELNELARINVQDRLDWINNTLQLLYDNVTVNPFILLMTTLLDSVSETNPVTQLLKQLHIAIDPENRSIELILDALHARSLGLDSKAEFILKALDEQTIDDVVKLLQMAQSYIYAAGSGFDFAFPVGHNGVINEFALSHKDIFKDFEELPTLDSSVANMYALEILKYLNELDKDNPTSWIALSNSNRANKRLRLVTTEANYTKAKLDLFDVLLKATSLPTKFTVGDTPWDLLEGADKIVDEDIAVKLHKLEDLFYINLHKALAKGKSFKEILLETHLLEALSENGNLSEIVRQTTADLDENINYGKLTDFDKFVYILTIAGISSNEFNNFIKLEIELLAKEDPEQRKVPLTILEQTSRLAMSHIKSRDLFLLAFDYLSGVLDTELRPFLGNIVFIDGSAGVGKTTVIAKNASKYIKSDKIWLSAPLDTLLTLLLGIIGKGEARLRKDLLELILDPDTYAKILKLLEGTEVNTDLITSKPLGENTRNTTEVLNNLDLIKFNTLENMPELIIIDEITHFSGIELLILNEFAKRNNISIIGLGDTILNGFTGISRNINREKLITFRSSRLSITLRDVNLLKQDDLLAVAHITSSMSRLDKDRDKNYDQLFAELIKLARKLNFNVYNLDEINGDLITNSLTADQVKKLYGTVAFVGDTSKEAYKTLSENYDKEKIKVLKPQDILGQEFDFIIVDLDFEDPGNYTLRWFDFLTNLYTLMSRGKAGSIFIDNGLSNIIGKNTISSIKELAPNLREALEPFIDAKLENIEKLNLVSNEDFEKLINTEESNKPENSPEEKASDDSSEDGLLPTDESLIEKNPYKSDEDTKRDTDNIYKVLDDHTDERVEESEQIIQLDPDFPIRIYGSAHFSGLEKEVVNDKSRSSAKTTYWHNPHWPVKTDLLIFMKDDTVKDNEITPLVDSMLNLKSVILYGDDPKTLHTSVSSVVDAEHLKNIKFKLEVRPRNEKTDNFVGLTGLLENGPEGNRPDINGLVYVLVGEFKNNAEEDCKITLGLIANPDSYFVNDTIKGTSKESEVNDKIDRYRKVFEGITLQYKREGKFYLEVFPHFSGVTNIRRYTGVGEARQSVKIRDLAEFRKTHPHTKISNPYIFVGDNIEGYNKIDALRGRAVVFVSDDTTLNEDDLMSIYISQKEATNRESGVDMFHLKTTKPRVRMLILDPKGVSFKSLTFSKKLYLTLLVIGENIVTKDFPFEEEYMGARMYTSLWNYRANLIRFLEAYKTWLDKTGYTDKDVLRIARYSDALYKKSNSDSSEYDELVEEILSSSDKASLEEINELNKFNDSLASSVRLFRLGGSRKRSGVYLRRLTAISSENPYYLDVEGTPIGIYITPQTAKKHLDLIKAILDESLGPYIKLEEHDKKTNKITKWPEDRLVSPKLESRDPEHTYNANPKGYRNSLSGLVSELFSENEITIEEDGKEFTLGIPKNSKKLFILVPVALLRIYSLVRSYLDDPEIGEDAKVKIGRKDSRKSISCESLVKIVESSVDDEYFDSSLDDLFALAFHGTTADPQTKGLRATDAYFKNGLYIDPMGAEVVGETSKGKPLFRKLLTDESLFTINVDVDMPIFTITLRDIEKSLEDSQTPEPLQEDIIPEDIKLKWSSSSVTPLEVLGNVLELFKTTKSAEEFQLKAASIINEFYQERILKLLENNGSPDDILHSGWSIDPITALTLSVLLYLESLAGESLESAEPNLENGKLSLTLPGKEIFYEVYFNSFDNSLNLSKTVANIKSEDSSEKDTALQMLLDAKNKIREYLSDPNKAKIIDDFRSLNEDNEEIYQELTANLDFYNSIESLSEALTDFYDRSLYDDFIGDLSATVDSIKNDKNCS